MVIALYCPMEATTTKITKKQKTLLTELLEDFDGDVEDLLGKHGQVMELKRRGLEAMLEGEFTDHLGDEPHNPRATARGIHATGPAPKRSKSRMARWNWRFREIAMAASRPRSSKNAIAGSKGQLPSLARC